MYPAQPARLRRQAVPAAERPTHGARTPTNKREARRSSGDRPFGLGIDGACRLGVLGDGPAAVVLARRADLDAVRNGHALPRRPTFNFDLRTYERASLRCGLPPALRVEGEQFGGGGRRRARHNPIAAPPWPQAAAAPRAIARTGRTGRPTRHTRAPRGHERKGRSNRASSTLVGAAVRAVQRVPAGPRGHDRRNVEGGRRVLPHLDHPRREVSPEGAGHARRLLHFRTMTVACTVACPGVVYPVER